MGEAKPGHSADRPHGSGCTCEKCFGKATRFTAREPLAPGLSWIPVSVDPGQYEAVAYKHEVRNVARWGGRRVLFLWFKIISTGKFFETEIFRSYNYPEKISPVSEYATEWQIANGGKWERRDQLLPKVFYDKVFLITVRPVKSGKYSLVESIDQLVQGGNGK